MARDITRDVVRGLTVLEMETCNNSSTPIFAHASPDVNGITYADTVFPTFTFLGGMSPTPWHRNVSLVGLGLAYNSLALLRVKRGDTIKVRFPGVLQRTGLSSIVFNSFPSLCPRYPLIVTGLWSLITVGLAENKREPFATLDGTAQSKLDTAVFTDRGLYRPGYDPEGLLGVLMTSVTMWFGAWYARENMSLADSVVTGSSLMAAGSLLGYLVPNFFPISKSFWTPSFTLIAAGYSVTKYAAVAAAVPYLPTVVSSTLANLGKRSLEVFLASSIGHGILSRWRITDRAREFLAQYLGETAADLVVVGVNNAAMALFATVLVKYRLRIKF